MEQIYHKEDFLVNHETNAFNNLIDHLFPKCLGIARRYCKTDEQADIWATSCFVSSLKAMLIRKEEEFSEELFLNEYIKCIVKTILEHRKGILVADTTIVSVSKKADASLFSNSEYYKSFPIEEIIQHIRKLNVLQQIIYNMIVIDNFSINEVANILQHNELSIKALLEKAKHNLYSSIKSVV